MLILLFPLSLVSCKTILQSVLLFLSDLRIKSENDYQGGYNTSPPPALPMPTTNYHDKPADTSPVPQKTSPDIWPAKIITSKSGGIATADGKIEDIS